MTYLINKSEILLIERERERGGGGGGVEFHSKMQKSFYISFLNKNSLSRYIIILYNIIIFIIHSLAKFLFFVFV